MAELSFVHDLLGRLRKVSPNDLVGEVSIKPFERPDFVLTHHGQEIGLEVTESVFQEYRRGEKLHFSLAPDCCVTTTNLWDRPERRSNGALMQEMLLGEYAPWQPVSEYLGNWKAKVGASFRPKLTKLNQAGFRRYAQNWCLIFDDPPLDSHELDYNRSEKLLLEVLLTEPAAAISFDRLFLLSGDIWFWWQHHQLRVFWKDRLRATWCARAENPSQ
ncbi:MAG: hypothetical protein U0V70_00170 [Terriglobia bacterium]